MPRCVGPSQKLEDFAVFCPKALAGIGRLPTTVADRTIEIALKRKATAETVARFRRREVAEAAEPLHQALTALASHHVDELAEARPDLPDELDDRAQDAWEPFLAIADRAGGDWPKVARQAALALSDGRATANEDSDRLQLLGDVRDILDRLDCGRILTADLITELARDDESPWTEWWDEREDKPKKGAAMKLASKLRPFGIHSRDIRAPEGARKGYYREQFEDAWARYLPVFGAESHDSRDNPHEHSDSGPSERGDTTPLVAAFEEAPNPHEQTDVAAVAAQTPEHGDVAGSEAAANPHEYSDVAHVADKPVQDTSGEVDQDEIERLAVLARKAQVRDPEQNPGRDFVENERAILAEVEQLLAEGVLVRRDEGR